MDFSLFSPSLLFKFVDAMQDDWNLGHAGRIGYLDAIADFGGLLKSEWSIGIGIDWADFNRNLLAKGGQNRFQNDEVSVNQ